MFSTRFIRKDGQPDEIYSYNAVEDAVNHLRLFKDDDSDLYRNISVLDEKNGIVLSYIHFDRNGKIDAFLNDGDTVKIRPEWSAPGEEKYFYRVLNINENVDRCDIKCLNSSLSLGSVQTVDTNMISVDYSKG